jgi:hypothetical protein
VRDAGPEMVEEAIAGALASAGALPPKHPATLKENSTRVRNAAP